MTSGELIIVDSSASDLFPHVLSGLETFRLVSYQVHTLRVFITFSVNCLTKFIYSLLIFLASRFGVVLSVCLCVDFFVCLELYLPYPGSVLYINK